MKNTFIKSIRSLKTIGILFLAFFLLCPSVYSSPLAMNKHDFAIKGFHIDLRCEVMTMPALKNFAKELAEFGINTKVLILMISMPPSPTNMPIPAKRSGHSSLIVQRSASMSFPCRIASDMPNTFSATTGMLI